jgi:glycine hydroxymethyltransferase
VDETERMAIERAKQLFGADHANVQPHPARRQTWPPISPSLSGRHHLGLNTVTAVTSRTVTRSASPATCSNIIAYGVNSRRAVDYDVIRKLAPSTSRR